VETPHVLIVTDEPEFGRQLTARWQTEPRVPALTQVSSDLWNPASASGYHLVILGPLAAHRAAGIVQSFGPAGVLALCVVENDGERAWVEAAHGNSIVVPRQNDWATVVVLLAGEILRRVAAQHRAERAEYAVQSLERRAALGRYMLEMRPAFNDALTSALGNADLLLLESTGMSAEALERMRTLHRMTLRLNEMMQRFSSLASELQLIERDYGSAAEEDDGLLAGKSGRERYF
jgi:signal transduction histidine kinase